MSEAGHTERTAARRAFKPYSAYKDSGVDWLGRIPAHWTVSRIGELTRLVNGHPFDSAFFTHGDGAPLVRIRDLNAVAAEVNYVGPSVETAWIQTGDVIIGMDGEFNVARWQGRRALLNQRMCCLRARAATEIGFIAYLLPFPLKAINDLAYSTTVKHLSSFEIRQIRVAEPPETEQQAIAAFLDRETARIDALVAKNERLIELLEETRTALITRAVAKGLDPNVPMKDSGVDWLGEIPAHWDNGTLRRFWTVMDCKHRTAVYVDEGIPIVSTTEVKPGRLKLDGPRKVGEADFNDLTRDGRKPRRGDVIYSRNASLGSAAYVDTNAPFCMGQDVCLITSPADQLYLAYQLNSRNVLGQIEAVSVGSTFDRINVAQIKNFQVVRPPEKEQRAIAAFLDRETARIDALVAKVHTGIDRLRELRTALISAAVTGKIDVREEVA